MPGIRPRPNSARPHVAPPSVHTSRVPVRGRGVTWRCGRVNMSEVPVASFARVVV
jgi:hypothetical protein